MIPKNRSSQKKVCSSYLSNPTLGFLRNIGSSRDLRTEVLSSNKSVMYPSSVSLRDLYVVKIILNSIQTTIYLYVGTSNINKAILTPRVAHSNKLIQTIILWYLRWRQILINFSNDNQRFDQVPQVSQRIVSINQWNQTQWNKVIGIDF